MAASDLINGVVGGTPAAADPVIELLNDDLSSIGSTWTVVQPANSDVSTVGGRLRITSDTGYNPLPGLEWQTKIEATTLSFQAYVKRISTDAETALRFGLRSLDGANDEIYGSLARGPSNSESWLVGTSGPAVYYNSGLTEGWLRFYTDGRNCGAWYSTNAENDAPGANDWTQEYATFETTSQGRLISPAIFFIDVYTWGAELQGQYDVSNLSIHSGGVPYVA